MLAVAAVFMLRTIPQTRKALVRPYDQNVNSPFSGLPAWVAEKHENV